VAADERHPGDLFVINLQTHAKRRLTHLNRALLDQVTLPELQPFAYKTVDGWDMQGFLAKPQGWKEGTAYPMILMIHGGPNGMWGFQWNHQLAALTGHGWAVLMTNPRGSSGYGESFQRGVNKEWGGKAYEDIMWGVDAALAKFSWIDRNRLGVFGVSYGGFMTNWIVGHTDRFKAAATLAGISDFISVEGIRDGFYGHRRDFGGDLFENFDLYWKYSPVRYASRIKTPTLVVHGESDQRVPLPQGEEFFRALRHFHVPSELVIFPREGHGVRTEPKHIVELMNWQIYWFDRYLLGRTDGVRPNAERNDPPK
jgi:acylaminoacyl-peptidase